MTSIPGIADAASTAEVGGRRYAITQYRMPAKVFHWITAGLVFFMVASGVTAKQLSEGAAADLLFAAHKLAGLTTLCVVLLRLSYRLLGSARRSREQPPTRPVLHWTLYGLIVLVPLLAWSGLSAAGDLEILPGLMLPAIWPQGGGHDDLLLRLHAYFAFGLLALVALHIGVAMQDYMNNARAAERPD